jgi:hypothetical protein
VLREPGQLVVGAGAYLEAVEGVLLAVQDRDDASLVVGQHAELRE